MKNKQMHGGRYNWHMQTNGIGSAIDILSKNEIKLFDLFVRTAITVDQIRL